MAKQKQKKNTKQKSKQSKWAIRLFCILRMKVSITSCLHYLENEQRRKKYMYKNLYSCVQYAYISRVLHVHVRDHTEWQYSTIYTQTQAHGSIKIHCENVKNERNCWQRGEWLFLFFSSSAIWRSVSFSFLSDALFSVFLTLGVSVSLAVYVFVCLVLYRRQNKVAHSAVIFNERMISSNNKSCLLLLLSSIFLSFSISTKSTLRIYKYCGRFVVVMRVVAISMSI